MKTLIYGLSRPSMSQNDHEAYSRVLLYLETNYPEPEGKSVPLLIIFLCLSFTFADYLALFMLVKVFGLSWRQSSVI